jgi:hypothetical protein
MQQQKAILGGELTENDSDRLFKRELPEQVGGAAVSKTRWNPLQYVNTLVVAVR